MDYRMVYDANHVVFLLTIGSDVYALKLDLAGISGT
jgi:hypothetical protein